MTNKPVSWVLFEPVFVLMENLRINWISIKMYLSVMSSSL